MANKLVQRLQAGGLPFVFKECLPRAPAPHPAMVRVTDV